MLHPAHGAARSAMHIMQSASATLADAEKALLGITDPTAAKRMRAGAEKRLADITKAASTAREALDQHRTKIGSEIDAAIGVPEARESVTAAMRAGDIRAHIRSLGTPTARVEALRSAIQGGDREAASAALSCSPLALGLNAEQVRILRPLAEEQFAGPLVALRSGLGRVREIVERAETVTTKRFGGIVGRGDTREAKQEAALRALETGGAA